MFHKKKLRLRAVIPVLMVISMLAVSPAAALGKKQDKKADSLQDVIQSPIGEMMGSTYETVSMENGTLPDDVEMAFFNAEMDGIQALREGKIGSYINCRIYAQTFAEEFDDLMVFPESLADIEYSFGFQKGSPLCKQFNDAMQTMKETGEEQAIYDKWLSGSTENVHCIEQDWTGENGTLEYWLNVGTPPMAYISEGGRIEGLVIDYILTACRIMGYNVNITECSFSGLIPALQMNKADIAGRSMAVTEERKKSIDFSDPFIISDVVLLVRKDSVSDAILSYAFPDGMQEKSSQGFLKTELEQFRKTFIEDKRWSLFLEGIGVTLFITIVSAILGTLLGLMWNLLYYQKIRWINVIIRTFNRWVSGIPAVVSLMIMYYIVFSFSSISGIAVAIVTFAILFSIGVFGFLEAGAEAVGMAQIESAIDLGFTKNQIYRAILLPQVITYALPLYRAKLVEHLKATAIVGYIAVVDLTKVCDMIRSRTFEAFFPLLATAVLYYLLGRLLEWLLTKAEKRRNSGKGKRRLLMGVKVHDRI